MNAASYCRGDDVSNNRGVRGSLPSLEKEKEQGGRYKPRIRIIGIYGPRRAGKTCYLATALLGFSTSSSCTVILGDEESRELLLRHWECLERGELPPATELSFSRLCGAVVIPVCEETDLPENSSEVSANEPLTGEQKAPKRRIRFQTRDFGGRLAERTETERPELSKEFKRWLTEEADCLLFFLAVDQLQDSQEAKQRLLEVDTLLDEIMKKSAEGQAIRKPIGILVTKWDLISDLSGSPEEEGQKLRQFLSDRAGDIGRSVCEKIERAGERVAVFPVSTFGGHVDSKPIHPLRPFNLHEPLVWVLQQSDFYLYEETKREAESALQGLWKKYSKAIAAYTALKETYGIVEGPIYEKVQAELTRLRQARKRRTLRTTILGGVILGSLVLYGFYRVDQRRYVVLRDRIETRQEAFPDLQSEVQKYLTTWNPWAGLLGHKGDIQGRWKEYCDQMAQDFQALEKLRKSPAPSTLEERYNHHVRLSQMCQDFCRKYPKSPDEEQVQAWQAEAEERRPKLEFCLAVERLVSQDPSKSKDVHVLIQEAETLQKNAHPGSSDPEVQQALLKLNRFMRDCNAIAGDIKAQVEKFIADADDWATRCQKALSTSPVDLEELRDLQTQGGKLHTQEIVSKALPPELKGKLDEKVKDIASQMKTLREKIQTTEQEIENWKKEAGEAERIADSALDLKNESVEEMEKASEGLGKVLNQRPSVQSTELEQLVQRLNKLKDNLNAEIKHYKDFDDAYKKLAAQVSGKSPEEKKREIETFLNRYSDLDYPRRGKIFKELNSEIARANKGIEESRWKKVQESYISFETSAQNSDFDLEEVRRKYDELVKTVDNYLKSTDPPPQKPQDAQDLQKKAERLLDETEWAYVQNFAKKNDKQYEEIARKAKAYLDGEARLPADKKKHTQDAEALIRRALADRAKELYQAFYERASRIANTENISSAKKEWQKFKEWRERPPQEWIGAFLPQEELAAKFEAGENWVKWAEQDLNLQKETWVEVTIDTTPVADRQIWCEAFWNGGRAKIWFDQANPEVDQTPWFNSPKTILVKIPPTDFRQAASEMHIKVTIDNWFGDTSATVKVRFPDVVFPGGRSSQEFEFPVWEGKKAKINFQCKELTPPPLPSP